MNVYEAGFHGSYSGMFPHEDLADAWANRVIQHHALVFGSDPDAMWRSYYCHLIPMDEFTYYDLYNGASKTFFDPGA